MDGPFLEGGSTPFLGLNNDSFGVLITTHFLSNHLCKKWHQINIGIERKRISLKIEICISNSRDWDNFFFTSGKLKGVFLVVCLGASLGEESHSRIVFIGLCGTFKSRKSIADCIMCGFFSLT